MYFLIVHFILYILFVCFLFPLFEANILVWITEIPRCLKDYFDDAAAILVSFVPIAIIGCTVGKYILIPPSPPPEHPIISF